MVRPEVHSSRTGSSTRSRPSPVRLHSRGPTLRTYWDASALVKFFVDEESRHETLRWLSDSTLTATSRISYVECRAAFARARRDQRLTERAQSVSVRNLDERWPDLQVVELDEALGKRAGELTQRHALRAADAIHLASAETIAEGLPSDTRFACWDGRLWEAAIALGFRVLPGKAPGLT